MRDIISRSLKDNELIFVRSDDTLNAAFAKMKLHDISQLPVLDNNKIVGIIDESDLLFALYKSKENFKWEVSKVMSTNLVKITPDEPIDTLIKIFRKGFVAIIESKSGVFYGIITQIDLINFLKSEKK